MLDSTDDDKQPFERNPALASVRQIAYELEQSLSEYK